MCFEREELLRKPAKAQVFVEFFPSTCFKFEIARCTNKSILLMIADIYNSRQIINNKLILQEMIDKLQICYLILSQSSFFS